MNVVLILLIFKTLEPKPVIWLEYSTSLEYNSQVIRYVLCVHVEIQGVVFFPVRHSSCFLCSGFGQQQQQSQQMQQQQFPDPWQIQQVPDQGYGQSWDSAGNRNSNNMGSGGTWQGYGGQTYNNFSGGYGRK